MKKLKKRSWNSTNLVYARVPLVYVIEKTRINQEQRNKKESLANADVTTFVRDSKNTGNYQK